MADFMTAAQRRLDALRPPIRPAPIVAIPNVPVTHVAVSRTGVWFEPGTACALLRPVCAVQRGTVGRIIWRHDYT